MRKLKLPLVCSILLMFPEPISLTIETKLRSLSIFHVLGKFGKDYWNTINFSVLTLIKFPYTVGELKYAHTENA